MFLTTDPTERRLVDARGLADVLGISPARVKALFRGGRLPAYQTGARQLRFDVAECLARLRARPGEGAAPERTS